MLVYLYLVIYRDFLHIWLVSREILNQGAVQEEECQKWSLVVKEKVYKVQPSKGADAEEW